MARILVVDDEPAVRAVLKMVLERAGHHVAAVGSGDDALRALEANPYDLAIVDIDMPRMDGFELCTRIKANSRYADTRLVMITGRPVDGVPEKARACGALDVIHKPFERSTLLANILTYLSAGKSE